MPLTRVVLGSLEEIEAALADAVSSARARDPLAPVTVLIGHVLLRPYLRRALAARGVAQLNVRYLRFNELATSMSGAANDERPRFLPGMERLLARDVAAGAAGYFGEIAGRDGFARALLRLFRELELGGFTPVTFDRALGSPTDEGSKALQLRELYLAYMKRRREFAAVTDHYAAALATPLEGPLLVYGAWAPARLQRDLIERIAERSDVTIFLPRTGSQADDAHLALRERAGGRGASTIDLAAVGERACDASRLDLAIQPALAGRDVHLVSAPDTVREVWECARTCLQWAREGIAFHEMAIAYRNMDPYRDLVDEIFAEAGIPAYIHDGRLLSAHPLGRRLLMLLELAANPEQFARADVMEFLTETELPRETRDAYDRVRPSEWEAYTREAGVVEGIAQWRERLGRLAREKREESRNEGWDWLAGVADRIETAIDFASDLHAALASRPDEATWDEHLAFVERLAEKYAAHTAPIVEVLRDLRALAQVRSRVSFEEFCRAVRDDLDSRDASRVLEGADAQVRLFGRNGVAVLDATSLRHTRFRAVYLLGVAERAWPPPSRPDPLLLEHERVAINNAGLGELPLRTKPDSEPLGFVMAVEAARERLALSFARADASRTGKHLPSYFFRAVVEALERRTLTLEELEQSAHVHRVEAGRLALEDIERSLSIAEYDRGLVRAAYEGTAPNAIAALTTVSPSFGAAVAARAARWSPGLTAYDGLMISPSAIDGAQHRSPFAGGQPVSASRLETYAECPYRYFLSYTIGARPVEEPEQIERIDHLQRGSLIHEILQKFLERIGRDDPPRRDRRPAHIPVLMDVAREVGEDYERRGVTGRPLIWRMDKRRIDDDLLRWYDVETADATGLKPGAFEARFGPAHPGLGDEDTEISRDEPIALTVDGRTIYLQGRIDRIDWDDDESRFRVIDYKTGKVYARGMFDGGKALQLPIYLRAAAELLNRDPRSGEAQYFYVTSRGNYRRHIVSGDALLDNSAEFERVLSTIAGGVDSGYFAPNPGKGAEHCRWCDYEKVCDKSIVKIMDRKTGDAAGAAYVAMGEIE